jgi:exo-1,4-beta-D-glucosaminidase
LARLPKVSVKTTSRAGAEGTDEVERVTLENNGKSLAFFVHLSVDAGGRDVAPVIWSDNYVSLMPGEKREITARVHKKDLRGAPARVKVDGWNVE